MPDFLHAVRVKSVERSGVRPAWRASMTKADAASFEELAKNYPSEAELCRRRAVATSGSQKEEWLRLSAEWIRLAKEADAMWWLTRTPGKPLQNYPEPRHQWRLHRAREGHCRWLE